MTPAPERVELLFFEVGTELFGVDASQVLRVERARAHHAPLAALGALRSGTRALMFRAPGGERGLRVDAVHGVRAVSVHALRRLPAPAAAAAPFALGVCLEGTRPVLLIDLTRTS